MGAWPRVLALARAKMADRRSRFVDERREPPEQHQYEGVGAALRRSRERLGLDLADIAVALRIQQIHLDALERGHFQELPGPAYAVGFVRSYARYLRLDDAAAVAQFKAETAIAPGPRRLVAPEPIGEARRPRALLIGFSLLLAAAVYGGWMWLQERDQLRLELVPEPPQTGAQLMTEPAPPASSAAVPDALAPSVAAAPAPVGGTIAQTPAGEVAATPTQAAAPESIEASAAAEEEEDEDEETTPPPTPISLPDEPLLPATEPPTLAAASVAAPSGAQVYGLENRDARVMLRAAADSWVRISGAANELVLERTLRTGDTYLVPNRRDLSLWTGNAGGLEVLVDGKPLPPLGALGAPKRDISLDPDRLLGGG